MILGMAPVLLYNLMIDFIGAPLLPLKIGAWVGSILASFITIQIIRS